MAKTVIKFDINLTLINMIIQAIVKSRAKVSQIEVPLSGNIFIIHTEKPAIHGEANRSIIELIADHFKVPKSSVKIKTGARSKIKILEIEEG